MKPEKYTPTSQDEIIWKDKDTVLYLNHDEDTLTSVDRETGTIIYQSILAQEWTPDNSVR